MSPPKVAMMAPSNSPSPPAKKKRKNSPPWKDILLETKPEVQGWEPKMALNRYGPPTSADDLQLMYGKVVGRKIVRAVRAGRGEGVRSNYAEMDAGKRANGESSMVINTQGSSITGRLPVKRNPAESDTSERTAKQTDHGVQRHATVVSSSPGSSLVIKLPMKRPARD